MIRWDVFKRLIKFAYFLEVDKEDGMGWSEDIYKKNWPSSRTSWARRRGDGMISWEVLKQLIELTYILYRCRERDGIIRSEIFKQLTYTYELVAGMGWDDQTRDLQTIDHVHVHPGDGWRKEKGWSEERYSNNLPQVHILSRGRRRGWDGMIRREIFKQLLKGSRTTWRRMRKG